MPYRARVGLTYPDPVDVATVAQAGGLKALQVSDPEAFAGVLSRLHRVEAGQPCDDVPEHSIPWLLAQGQIARVDEDA